MSGKVILFLSYHYTYRMTVAKLELSRSELTTDWCSDAVTEREETESRYSYHDVQCIATNGIVNTDTDRKQADGNTTLTSKHK